MTVFAWSEKYATSIRPIDNDHRGLFEAVAQLEKDINGGHGEVRIATTISSLILYVKEHFEREERFMWKAGYPDYQRHKAEHDNFRDTILALKEMYVSDPEGIDLNKVMTFLRSWLVNHILKVDSQYVPFVRGDKEGDNEALLGNRPRSSKMTEVRLKIPEEQVELVTAIVQTLSHEGHASEQLETALKTVLEMQSKRRLDLARKLFGA